MAGRVLKAQSGAENDCPVNTGQRSRLTSGAREQISPFQGPDVRPAGVGGQQDDKRSAGVFGDDETLIRALKARDEAAVAYAVETYAPKLYRYAFYQLNDTAAAEDLVSEVITRMLEKIDEVQYVGAPFQAWLFSIARNLVTDSYRRKGRAQVLSLDSTTGREAIHEVASLDPHLESLADRDALLKMMARLTDEQRQILTLRVIEGWQPAEIARLLGRSVDSVKSLQYRALQSLRRFWDRDLEEGEDAPSRPVNASEEVAD